MSQKVETYAKSLVDIANVEDHLPIVESELLAFAQAIKDNDNLRQTLSDSNIDVEQRVGVVGQILQGKVLATTKAIIALIVIAEHANDFDDIVKEFITQSSKMRDKVSAEIRSAVALDDSTVEKLTQALSKATGKDLDLHVVVDETVIGGIVATVGDQVIDGSLRTRLSKLKETIDG